MLNVNIWIYYCMYIRSTVSIGVRLLESMDTGLSSQLSEDRSTVTTDVKFRIEQKNLIL